MDLRAVVKDSPYLVHLLRAVDISIPMRFDGSQPNLYDFPTAVSEPIRSGSLVGDTRSGGSCNVETVRLTPHCNGTHTECVGHISEARIRVLEVLDQVMIPCTLITVTPVDSDQTSESTHPAPSAGDRLITRTMLQPHLDAADSGFLDGVVIRTRPNTDEKKIRQYGDEPAPFFSTAGMQCIVDAGVQHLVVDLPSVDRTRDEGWMTAHHLYWDVEQGSNAVDPAKHSTRTITELVFIPDAVPDGPYMLSLQLAPFVADAAPSRPVLIPVESLT